jgi:hypothetical protein
MPLRREMRPLYGARWRRKRSLALAARGTCRCDNCGKFHSMINWAHASGDPRIPGRMLWLCPSCHGVHDTPFRIAVTRRTRARRSGQLWLAPEIEYGHLPVSLWPARVVRALENEAQLDLFPVAA